MLLSYAHETVRALTKYHLHVEVPPVAKSPTCMKGGRPTETIDFVQSTRTSLAHSLHTCSFTLIPPGVVCDPPVWPQTRGNNREFPTGKVGKKPLIYPGFFCVPTNTLSPRVVYFPTDCWCTRCRRHCQAKVGGLPSSLFGRPTLPLFFSNRGSSSPDAVRTRTPPPPVSFRVGARSCASYVRHGTLTAHAGAQNRYH